MTKEIKINKKLIADSMLQVIGKEAADSRILRGYLSPLESESIARAKVAGYELDALTNSVKLIDGVNVIVNKVNNLTPGELNVIASGIKNKYPQHFLFIVSKCKDKLSMICQINGKFIDKGIFAGDVVKEASKIASGNGGGRKDYAQAGGKDTSKVEEILQYVNKIIEA